mgnify:CR=1 FL=1
MAYQDLYILIQETRANGLLDYDIVYIDDSYDEVNKVRDVMMDTVLVAGSMFFNEFKDTYDISKRALFKLSNDTYRIALEENKSIALNYKIVRRRLYEK